MTVHPLRTPALANLGYSLLDLIADRIAEFPERSILAVTSKIVSLAEQRVIAGDVDKNSLIPAEAEWYLPDAGNQYHISLAINQGILAATAGIDASNGNGNYVLWPENPGRSAQGLLEFVRQRYGIEKAGIIITDSHSSLLRWGTTGFALAHAGFLGLNPYQGKLDLFGRELQSTQANVADGLAAAAVAVMGEGNESTPLALITEVPFIHFLRSHENTDELRVPMQKDVYHQLLLNAPWIKGQQKN